MKIIIALAPTLAAAGLLMAPAQAQPAKARVGQPAPTFEAVTSEGEAVSLSDYEGQTVVLEWTNDGCPFVQKHYGSNNMQGLQKRAAADGVAWLSVISSAPGEQGHVDGAGANRLTAERKAAPTAVLLDEDGVVGRLYGAKTTPHMYVIDQDGTLRYAGAIDTIASTDAADVPRADNYVSAALAALKANQPVTVPQTQPYGCSVKYAG